MLSPIQTRAHWIRNLSFEPSEESFDPKVATSYTVNFTLSHQKVENHWTAKLRVEFGSDKDSRAPYHGVVEFEGIFQIHPDFPPEKTNDLVRMNGGAVLYGAARELILTLTSRAKHGPFELPTIDARVFISKLQSKKETEPKALE